MAAFNETIYKTSHKTICRKTVTAEDKHIAIQKDTYTNIQQQHQRDGASNHKNATLLSIYSRVYTYDRNIYIYIYKKTRKRNQKANRVKVHSIVFVYLCIGSE